jgi:hypothetical protein
VTNFHRNTLRALAELLGSAGLAHPDELAPWHLHFRHQSGAVLRGDAIYPRIMPGALLSGDMSEDLAREWGRAQPHTFEPAFV